MPFVPDLVSTTRYSNRSTDASAQSTSDSRPSDAAGTPALKPRFLPEPIETTRRTNRAVPSIETSVFGPNSPPSSNSSTPKATLLNSNNTEPVSQASASKFLPEPVETTRRSNRTQPVKPVDNTDIKRKGWGRDSCDDYADKEEHKPVILNRAHRIPVPIPGPGKSKWFPDEASGWGQQYNNQPATKNTQPANGTFGGANRSFLPLSSPSPQPVTAASGHDSHANVNDAETYFQSLPDSIFQPEKAISSQVRDQSNYRNNGDPRQFNHSTNETRSIAGVLGSTPASSNPANANSPTTVRSGDEHQEEEVAGTASLSCSPASSLKSNASGPNYLLDSSSSQQQEQQQHLTGLNAAAPAIASIEYLSPSSCEEAPSGLKHPNAILVRDFGYTSSRPTLLKLPKADASACSSPGVVPKVQQIPVQHNGPHTNINTGSYPQSGLLDPSTYTITSSTSSTFTKHSAVDLLRNQVLAAQSQLIKDKQSFLSPTYTPNHNKHLQPLNGSNEPKRKKPLPPFSFIPAASRPVNPGYLSPGSPYQRVLLSPGTSVTPLLCESPMATTLFYESSKMSSHGDYFTAKKQASGMSIASNADSVVSRDTALTTPSTRPSSPGPSKYGYPCTSTSSLVAMVCQTPQPICSDPPNMCPESREDVSTEFVVAVFNYLSLGHESIARKFDKELCEATGWGLERVTTDRLGALREYVEEYVDRKPRFGSGMAGW
ncbi:hypothetical protein TWF106_003665 [Orbilia oligospora]|uniref:Uncharacterized protein n=1 Tax=Orbilia oligospora TaxID=2813651 RepID=A0A7C8Q7N6_ORBOL|nr:hypothetical protein TWF788_004277 [Orbilia oligospora]KAF3199834.1 hypothetical protein TWF106_003665 [Orbilia oligospora]